MHGVHQQGWQGFRRQHQPMGAHEGGVVGAQRAREGLALLGCLDVAGVHVHGDAAAPADGAGAHGHELHALHHGEPDRQLHVAMDDGLHIGPRLEDLDMDRDLHGRARVALDHLAVEADEQHVLGRHIGAGLERGLDEEGLAAGRAHRHMARVVEQAFHHQQAGRGRRLNAQKRIRIGLMRLARRHVVFH